MTLCAFAGPGSKWQSDHDCKNPEKAGTKKARSSKEQQADNIHSNEMVGRE